MPHIITDSATDQALAEVDSVGVAPERASIGEVAVVANARTSALAEVMPAGSSTNEATDLYVT
eukprot:6488005-Amphidinium_carterae.1